MRCDDDIISFGKITSAQDDIAEWLGDQGYYLFLDEEGENTETMIREQMREEGLLI